jgi:hypothetical protein
MFAILAGLAAGLLHVFSGPDHLAAVAPLAADGRRGQWRTGLQWGMGHTAGVVLIALLLLVIRQRLPLDAISGYSERIVGLMLILVGGWGLWRARHSGLSSHAHAHGGASFAMGTFHGLAGSSHVFGVLPSLAFAAKMDSILYLAGFGVGAMAGMTAFAAGVGLIAMRFGSDQRRYRGLLYASSAAALVIGGVWLVGR